MGTLWNQMQTFNIKQTSRNICAYSRLYQISTRVSHFYSAVGDYKALRILYK